jgi:peptide/nickel transport system permease protein
MRIVLVKALRAIATVLICVTLVFVVLRLAGDPARMLLPDDTPPATLALYRARWGLDQPLSVQYVRYLAAVAHGDLGRSFADDREAWQIVAERIPATLRLGGAALALSLLIGVPAGILAAIRRNSWIDRVLMSGAVLGYATPHFFLGILLILVFAMQLRLLPASGSEGLNHMILPVLTLGSAGAGAIARFARTSMLEVMGRPFMRTIHAKGARPFYAITRHALPNAAIPVVTVVGFQLGGLVGGALVTETVFAWPGIGQLLVTAVGQRDLAVVQAIVLLIAATMVGANLLVDLLYGWLDPRVRASEGA